MSKLVRFYVGIELTKDSEAIKNSISKIGILKKHFSELFGGGTTYQASGVWLNEKNVLFSEKSLIFETVQQEGDQAKISEFVQSAKKVLQQECVLVTTQDIEANFM